MNQKNYTRKIVVTGVLAAVSSILMYLNFSLPIAPPYLKIDFSDFPALLASYAIGPISGLVVCLIKNLVSLPASSTMGVGELSNFLLSSSFVLCAGIYYKKDKTKKGALTASILGAVLMSSVAILTNYFLVYPAYIKLAHIPVDALIGLSSSIIPWVDSVIKIVVIFNGPFTLFKGLLNVLLTFLVYKRLSPLIQGKNR